MRAVLLAFVLTLAVLPAWAQTSTPAATPAPLPPEAQDALKKGVIAAQQQDYLLAIRYFQDARKLAPDDPLIFLDLGLAESKIPGRELRAIAWFGAYLAANPNAPNAAAVKDQIDVLDVKSQSNISRLIQSAQDAASQNSDSVQKQLEFGDVSLLWAQIGDFADAFKTADRIQISSYKMEALTRIAGAEIKLDDIEGARETLASALKIAVVQAEPFYSSGLKDISEAQADIGDIAAALKNADLIQLVDFKVTAQVRIARDQLTAGDIAGAQKTLALPSIRAYSEDTALRENVDADLQTLTQAQAKAGDIADALKTVDLIRGGDHWGADRKSCAQEAIVEAQGKAGDIAGALRTVELIQDAGWKSSALNFAAKAQAKAGDIAGAQKTADLIKAPWSKTIAESAIAEAQVKADSTINQASNVGGTEVAQAPVHPAIPVIKVWDWVEELDAFLKADPFLDLAGYLKSLPPSDNPQKVFESLSATAQEIVRQQNSIDIMLKQQAAR
jgi:tetratricopeptide (TPR) repeat protein